MFTFNRANLNIMNKVLVLLFSLVSSFVPQKTTSTNSFSTLRERIVSSVEKKTFQSIQNNTSSPMTLQNKKLDSKVTHLKSTIYALPS